MNDSAATFEGWCILELMGHRRLGGFLREEEIAGMAFLRIDIPIPDQTQEASTQFYNPSAVYAITPTTMEIATEIARQAPAPVQRWDLRKLLPETGPEEQVIEPEYEESPF